MDCVGFVMGVSAEVDTITADGQEEITCWKKQEAQEHRTRSEGKETRWNIEDDSYE